MGKKMAGINQLLPFANGETPNVMTYDEWNALAARLSGFKSGIASSQQFNYILAQGGAAGYVIGQMVADYTTETATISATPLYQAFKQAMSAFVNASPVTATGTTTPRNLSDRFADFVNVKDFGAKGDGVTDDTNAIQAAIDFCKDGAILFFPYGIFKVTKELSVDSKNGLRILGSGYGVWDLPSHGKSFTFAGTTILFSGTADKTRTIDNVSSTYSVTDPDYPSIEYALLNLTEAFSSAVFINNSQNIYIAGLRVQLNFDGVDGYNNTTTTGLGDDYDIGVSVVNSSFVTIDDCQIVGYWRKAGLLLANSTEESVLGQGVFNRIQHCFLQGFRGLAIRSSDEEETNVGVAGSSVRDCCITDLSHTSRLTATLLGFSSASSPLEVSGAVMRDVDFDNVHLFGSDCVALLNECTDVSFSACFAEATGWKSTVGGDFQPQGARFIATNETDSLIFDEATEFNYHVDFSPYARRTDSTRYVGTGLYAPKGHLFLAKYKGGAAPFEAASPDNYATFHITGNPGFRGFRICDDEYNPLFSVSEGGLVGINILRSAFPLQVLGVEDRATANNDAVIQSSQNAGIQLRAVGDGKLWSRIYNDGSTWRFSLSGGQNTQFNQVFYMNEGISACSGNFLPFTSGTQNLGSASTLWAQVYASTGAINTSDENAKTLIADPDESLVRAWEKVSFKVFKFKDAVSKKGEEAARLHVGVIAQQVIEAFESEGLDPFALGIVCYDEWGDQYEDFEIVDSPEVLNDDGEVVTRSVTHIERKKVIEAGSSFGIRYEEALALECACQRKRISSLEETIAKLVEKVGGI